MEKRYNVLFLCTGNSARSIMAESILSHRASPTITPHIAPASHPSGRVRLGALRQQEVSAHTLWTTCAARDC